MSREVEGYPFLVGEPVSVGDAKLSPEEKREQVFLRDYSYLTFLVENGQYEEAKAALARQPDRSKWPPSLLLLEARILVAQRRLDAARQCCEEVLARHPQVLEGYTLLAQIEMERDKLDDAIAALERGRKVAPANRQILELLGKLYRARMRSGKSLAERQAAVDKIERVYEDLVKAISGRAAVPYLHILSYIKQEKQKPKEALACLDRLVRLEPRRTDVRLQIAQLKEALGDPAGALATLKDAFVFDPTQNEVIRALDLALAKAGKSPLDFYKTLAETYPGRDPMQIQYVRMLLTEGKSDEAVRVLKTMLDLHPGNDTAWLLLAGAQFEKGHAAESRKAIEKYLAQSPGDPAALVKSVRLLLAFGATQDATRYLEQLRALQPGNADLPDLSLQVAFAAEDYERVAAEARKIIAERPDDVAKYPLLVQALGRLGRLGEAVDPLKKALSVASKGQWLLVASQLASVYQRLKRFDEALALLQEIVKRDPGNLEWQIALARLYRVRKENARVGETLARILKDHSQDAMVLHEVGVIKWEMGLYDEGESLLREAIRLNPNAAEFYNTLGYLFSERGVRLDEAMALVKKALQLQPHAGYIIDSLGWVHFRKGEFDKAAKTLEEAVAKEGNDPTILLHLGQAYAKLGRVGEALERFKQAAKITENSDELATLKQEIGRIENKK